MRRLRTFFRRGRVTVPGPEKKPKRGFWPLFALGLTLFALALSGQFLSRLSSEIAVSDASDLVSAEVNRVIARVMAQESLEGERFVRFERNEAGDLIAVSADMGRINALSAEILEQVVGTAENRSLRVRIPLGNLTGVSLLMGRGPLVPVEILMLTSSRVGFENSIVTAGINQTKHQILLTVTVDIDVLVPWGTESTQVKNQILIADTIVIGRVPETYMSFEP